MIRLKRNDKGGSPCSLKRYDRPILLHVCLITRVILSVPVTFCGNDDNLYINKKLKQLTTALF